MLIRPNKHGNCDALAEFLVGLGQRARSMPPAWDGSHVSAPVYAPDSRFDGPPGACIGRMLPGRGFYSSFDLKEIGITKPLPYVYEPSVVDFLKQASYRAAEQAVRDGIRRDGAQVPVWMKDPERGAITTYDGIIAARAGGKGFDRTGGKTTITTVSNIWSTMYRASGSPSAGSYTAIPGGAAHSRASAGAWSESLTNPTSPDKQYLLSFGYLPSSQINMMLLVDLLVCCGTISATSTSSQTVNSTALTRYTTGDGVLMVFDVTTALGATASNLTVTYTNQAGTASRSTGAIAMTTSAIVMRLQPAQLGFFMQMQAGDYGVRSVQSAQFSASMAAGVVALNIFYPLGWFIGLPANMYAREDSTSQIDGITEIAQTTGQVLGCLAGFVLASGTSSGNINFFMKTCQG